MDMALSENRDHIVRRTLRDLKERFGGKIIGRRLIPLNDTMGELIDRDQEPVVPVETSNARWFVLACHPLEERSAAAHLIGRRFKVYLPTIKKMTTRGVRRSKVAIDWPMFPGYLFIRLDPARDRERLHLVTSTPGINRFLQVGEDADYAVVPEHEMTRMQQVEHEEIAAHIRRTQPIEWSIGEQVRLVEGPLSGINAEIVRLDDEARITVLLTLLGRAVSVRLPSVQLEKL